MCNVHSNVNRKSGEGLVSVAGMTISLTILVDLHGTWGLDIVCLNWQKILNGHATSMTFGLTVANWTLCSPKYAAMKQQKATHKAIECNNITRKTNL